MPQNTGDNKFGVAKWIVDPSLANGTHSTIASALTSASSGETIFIRPGTYTENLTLKAGVNLSSFDGDAWTPNVTIVGKCTLTDTGTVTISGIRLQTNSDNCVVLSGTNASTLNLVQCWINCTNNTGISQSNANASINLYHCISDTTTTGIATFAISAGGSTLFDCHFRNSGSSQTANSYAGSASHVIALSRFRQAFTTADTVETYIVNCHIITDSGGSINTTSWTQNSTNANARISSSELSGGTQPALTIGAGAQMQVYNSTLLSTAANTVTGTGTYKPGNVAYHTTTTNSVSTTTPETVEVTWSKGISFNSGSDTLSVYDEGTFSPTLTNSGSAPTVTYDTQLGRYTQIGDRVFYTIFLDLASYTAGTGNTRISSLPFTSEATTNNFNIGPILLDDVTFGASVLYYQILVPANSTFMSIGGVRSATTVLNLVAAGPAATSVFRVTSHYEV